MKHLQDFGRAQDPRELTHDAVQVQEPRFPAFSGGSDNERPQEHQQETDICESPTEVTISTQQPSSLIHSANQKNNPVAYVRKMTNYLTPRRDHSRTSPVVEQSVGPNIVIFGETGVGKSSVVNLIAGEKLAHTSNAARGCTFRHERYPITLSNAPCTLWDTVGLDEGSEGTVPAKEAESNLKELMQMLAHSGGIHLIIYCIRGTRLTKALKRNYRLFYITICRRKVPVALVVTCLEHQQGDMNSWWNANQAELLRNGMWFDAHACVTTLYAADNVIQQRRKDSEVLLRNLVADYSGHPGWKADSTLSRFMPQFHNVLRDRDSPGNTKTPRRVLVCGPMSGILPGTDKVCQLVRGTANIDDRQYEFLRVDEHSLRTIKSKDWVGAGLLLFYSNWEENWPTSPDATLLKDFCQTVVAKIRPVIVVLQGCDDEQVAEKYNVKAHDLDIQAHFVPIRRTDDTGAKLVELIKIMCMEQAEVKTRKLWNKNT